MLTIFPPEEIIYSKKVKSNWREFQFMFHQIQHIINPIIALHDVIMKWNVLRLALAESPRKRRLQIESYDFP